MNPAKAGFMFTYGHSATNSISVLLRYFGNQGLKKVALLAPIDASGQEGERSVDTLLALPENKSLTLVAREHFNGTDPTVVAQLSRIKAAGTQALVAWGTGSSMGTVFHGILDVGLDIPVGVSPGNMLYAQMKQYEDFLPKDLVSGATPGLVLNSLPNGRLKVAVKKYVDAFTGIGLHADGGYLLAWDAAWILVESLRKLGVNATAPQIRDYIEGLHDWPGASGIYDFRDGMQRGLTDSSIIMVKWDRSKDGWVGLSKLGGAPL
jgi:ABC-type branched-subunit amino acid transport system substrate-binding protein